MFRLTPLGYRVGAANKLCDTESASLSRDGGTGRRSGLKNAGLPYFSPLFINTFNNLTKFSFVVLYGLLRGF
jgi:hypothetical protein